MVMLASRLCGAFAAVPAASFAAESKSAAEAQMHHEIRNDHVVWAPSNIEGAERRDGYVGGRRGWSRKGGPRLMNAVP
jgi:hypothetical protein